MVFQYTPFIIPLLISSIVLIVVGLFAWRHQAVPAARTFGLVIICLFIWTVGYILEIISVGIDAKIFWANVQFMGIMPLPPLWMIMTLQLTGHKPLRREILLALSIVPTVTILLAWTDDYHHLFRGQPTLDTTSAPFPLLNADYGLWYDWVVMPYTYLLYGYSLFILLGAQATAKPPYRSQFTLLIVSLLIPLLAATLYNLHIPPFRNLDPAPAAFSMAGVLVAWALFRYRLFDLVLVARDFLVENMSDGLIMLDARNRILDINLAARRLIGDPSVPLIGQDADVVFAGRPELLTAYRDALAGGAEVRLHEEPPRYLYMRVSSLPDYYGNSAGRLLILHDITERKKAQEDLQRSNDELRARNQELDAFTHTVAHDLKNPLVIMVGYAELLAQTSAALSPQEREHLWAIVRNGQRMNRIIDELLLLSSVRQADVKSEPLDMAAIVAEVQMRMADLIQRSKSEIVIPPAEAWPVALGYAPWIEEVWVNYISNAIKYGGDPPRVEVGAALQPDGQARFWVKDNGRGLSPEEQAKLFIPFTRLNQARIQGHGLGLSIVRRIVEKLGGTVGVESEGVPGQGSLFYFTLPTPKQAADMS